jgi:hypothetical protein
VASRRHGGSPVLRRCLSQHAGSHSPADRSGRSDGCAARAHRPSPHPKWVCVHDSLSGILGVHACSGLLDCRPAQPGVCPGGFARSVALPRAPVATKVNHQFPGQDSHLRGDDTFFTAHSGGYPDRRPDFPDRGILVISRVEDGSSPDVCPAWLCPAGGWGAKAAIIPWQPVLTTLLVQIGEAAGPMPMVLRPSSLALGAGWAGIPRRRKSRRTHAHTWGPNAAAWWMS